MKKILCAALAALYWSVTVSPAWANPSFIGAEAGSMTIEEKGPVYNIYSSDGAIGAYDSFSNQAHETINSIQASADHTALFRVTGSEPSMIFGALNANSRVFLINPNGIVFAPGSQLNAPGLVASAIPISNSDFSAGRYAFEGAGGTVVNQGSIAGGLYVVLIGSAVSNEGDITAPSIGLAAGGGAKLILDPQGLVSIDVDKATGGATGADGNPVADAIRNSGTLTADGGAVLLTARAAEGVFDNVINHTGVIRARSVGLENGVVTLYGGDAGIVRSSGLIDASGKNAGEKGGTVHILGEKVGLFDSAKVDVSGDSGGGTVLLGGDYKGGNALIPNADFTYASEDALIDARAIRAGDGGKVIAWGDEATRFYGTIDARGGAESGDGGFVETSAKYLDVIGIDVLASSATGLSGTWLLDPLNIEIQGGGTFNTSQTTTGGTVAFAPTGPTSTLLASTINATLSAGTNVIVTTDVGTGAASGDISVNAAIVKSTGPFATLTLNAIGSILLNAPITLTSPADVYLTAGGAIQGDGGGSGGNAAVDITLNGNLVLRAQNIGNVNELEVNNLGAENSLYVYHDAILVNQKVQMEVLGNNFKTMYIEQARIDGSVALDLVGASDGVSISPTTGAVIFVGTVDSTAVKPNLLYTQSGTGNIQVSGFTTGVSSYVALTATDGDIVNTGSGINAGTVFLEAGGTDGDVGTSLARFLTNADHVFANATGTGEVGLGDTASVIYSVTTEGGNVDVLGVGPITVPFAFSDGGTITLATTSNNLSIGIIDAHTGDVNLTTAGAGNILDANGIDLNITADAATFDTGTGNVGTLSDPIEYKAGTQLITAPVGGSVFLTEFVPDDGTDEVGGLLFTNGRITGGDNISELTSSLYGEESGGSEESGGEDEEEEDKDSTETYAAENVATQEAPVEEAPESDKPAVEEQAFAPCGV